MRAWRLALLVILLLTPLASAGRQFPAEAYEQGRIPITFTLEGATAGERVVLGERIPAGSTLVDWRVHGGVDATHLTDGEEHVWEFTATTDEPSISYVIDLGEGTQADFDAVYAMPPDYFGRSKDRLPLTALATREPQEQAPAPVPETKRSPAWTVLTLLVALIGLGALFYHKIHESERINAEAQAWAEQAQRDAYWKQEHDQMMMHRRLEDEH